MGNMAPLPERHENIKSDSSLEVLLCQSYSDTADSSITSSISNFMFRNILCAHEFVRDKFL